VHSGRGLVVRASLRQLGDALDEQIAILVGEVMKVHTT
jgi:hypothetical protein